MSLLVQPERYSVLNLIFHNNEFVAKEFKFEITFFHHSDIPVATIKTPVAEHHTSKIAEFDV